MSYHRYNPNDEPSAPDGDLGFIGVEMRYQPSQLPPGYVPEAVNVRFQNGVGETRKGSVKPGWTNKVTAQGVEAWGTVYGHGQFTDADRREWFITAADGNIYASLANNATRQIPLPAGVTVTESCHFEQANNTLVLMRGLEADPLELTDLAEGFTVVPDPEVEDAGLSAMPRGVKSLWIANRLWIQTADDQVWASDELDIHTYDESRKFKIDQGASDPLVTITPFGRTDIICLKRHSVFRLTSIVGDLVGTQALPITRRFGCLAAKSVVDVGTDLLWFSDEGIASLTLTEFGELQASEGRLRKQPWFSDPIDPLIKRIDSTLASGIVATIWNRHLYVAVPLRKPLVENLIPSGAVYDISGSYTVSGVLPGFEYLYVPGANEVRLVYHLPTGHIDDREQFTGTSFPYHLEGVASAPVTAAILRTIRPTNTAILVYNFNSTPPPGQALVSGASGAWCGYDTSEAWDVQDLFVAPFAGRQRLFLIGLDGWITLYEETYTDQDRDLLPTQVETQLTTRGYLLGKPLSLKRTTDLMVQIQTWNPTYTLSLLCEGVSREDVIVAAATRDRTKYTRPFNAEAYDEDNPDDTFLDAHREDYSVELTTATSPAIDLGQNGIQVDIHQESTVQFSTRSLPARAPQIKLLNTTGRIRLLAAGLEGFEDQRRDGVYA